MKELSKQRKGVFFLILSAFLYSIMPVLIRLLGKGGIPPISQVFLRYIFAFLSASIYFFTVSKAKIKINRRDIFTLLIITIFGYALTNLAFTYGILYTQVGNALFLFYSYAIIAPILGFFILKDKINLANIASLILSFIALILLFQPNALPTWKVGGFFAILAALGQSIYLILRKKLSKIPANMMMLVNTFVGMVVLAGLGLLLENKFYFQGGINQISTKTWIATMLFGVDNFLAWFTMTKGFEYFKATTGSIILLSELIFGIVFAFVFFNEIPTAIALVGGMLILISASLVIIKGEN